MNIIVGICACLVLGGAVVIRRLGVYMCECAGVCEFLGDVCVSACMCVCVYTRAIIELVMLYCIRRAKPRGLHEVPRTKLWMLSLCGKHFNLCERTMDSLIELSGNGGW